MFDWEFANSLTFPDIVSLNFSLTVDPKRKRLPGSPNVVAPVIMQPLCKVPIISGSPAVGKEYQPCGTMATAQATITTPGEKKESTEKLDDQ